MIDDYYRSNRIKSHTFKIYRNQSTMIRLNSLFKWKIPSNAKNPARIFSVVQSLNIIVLFATYRRTRYHGQKFRNVANNFIHDWKIGKKTTTQNYFVTSLKKTVICWFFYLIKRGHTNSKNINSKLSNFLFRNSKVSNSKLSNFSF